MVLRPGQIGSPFFQSSNNSEKLLVINGVVDFWIREAHRPHWIGEDRSIGEIGSIRFDLERLSGVRMYTDQAIKPLSPRCKWQDIHPRSSNWSCTPEVSTSMILIHFRIWRTIWSSTFDSPHNRQCLSWCSRLHLSSCSGRRGWKGLVCPPGIWIHA